MQSFRDFLNESKNFEFKPEVLANMTKEVIALHSKGLLTSKADPEKFASVLLKETIPELQINSEDDVRNTLNIYANFFREVPAMIENDLKKNGLHGLAKIKDKFSKLGELGDQ
jgi:hypothetical protein